MERKRSIQNFSEGRSCLSEQKSFELRAYGYKDQPEATYDFAKRVLQAEEKLLDA